MSICSEHFKYQKECNFTKHSFDLRTIGKIKKTPAHPFETYYLKKIEPRENDRLTLIIKR